MSSVPSLEHHTRPGAPGTSSGSPSLSQRLQSDTAGPSNSIWMSGNWVLPVAAGAPGPSSSVSAPPEMRAAPAAPLRPVRRASVAVAAPGPPDLADEPDPNPPPDEEGFPSQLSFLSRLHSLSMSCCDLEAAPPVIGHLTSLRSLVISGNRPHATRHAFFFLPFDCRSLVVRCRLSLLLHPQSPSGRKLQKREESTILFWALK